MNSERFFYVGKITGVHGIKGAVKIHEIADSENIFAPGSRLYPVLPNQKNKAPGKKQITIKWSRPYRKGLITAIDGVDHRNAAKSLVGSALFSPISAIPALDPEIDKDTYYHFQLIGLSVSDTGDTPLGTLTEIIETGANDVYVVANGDHTILLPAIKSVIKKIDLETGYITVIPPEY